MRPIRSSKEQASQFPGAPFKVQVWLSSRIAFDSGTSMRGRPRAQIAGLDGSAAIV
jgi:hypothetical protein